MARELRPAGIIEAFRVRLAQEPQRASDSDIGVPDPLAPPAAIGPRPSICLERLENALDLRATTLDPDWRGLLVKDALVDEDHGFVSEPGRQGADLERVAPRRALTGDERPFRPDQFVKIIQNGGTLDERLAVIGHQHRYSAQWIEGYDSGRVPERRPWPVLIWKTIENERDGDASDERGIVLADQDHNWISGKPPLAGLGRGTRPQSTADALRTGLAENDLSADDRKQREHRAGVPRACTETTRAIQGDEQTTTHN